MSSLSTVGLEALLNLIAFLSQCEQIVYIHVIQCVVVFGIFGFVLDKLFLADVRPVLKCKPYTEKDKTSTPKDNILRIPIVGNDPGAWRPSKPMWVRYLSSASSIKLNCVRLLDVCFPPTISN